MYAIVRCTMCITNKKRWGVTMKTNQDAFIFETVPLPCPKCGNTEPCVEGEDDSAYEYVICYDCEYKVKRKFFGSAVAYWNQLKRKPI